MTELYSLKELAAMKKATEEACVDAWVEATKGGKYKTARELSDACGGLATAQQVAGKMLWLTDESYCRHALPDEKRPLFNDRYKKVKKIRHLAELDENGNIVRRFDSFSTRKMKTYAVDEKSR